MVGDVIREAKGLKEKLGAGCPVSAEWILDNERINDIGKASVHQGAAPTAADVRYVMNLKELPGRLPDWVSRPESGPVLYIFACGNKGSRGPAVPERVLCNYAQAAAPEAQHRVGLVKLMGLVQGPMARVPAIPPALNFGNSKPHLSKR